MDVKYVGSTRMLHPRLQNLRVEEADGIPGGAVKCVDIRRNTNGEGSLLGHF